MSKVIYKQGTKATYLGLAERLSTALYFCTDTKELFKGDDLYTDGLRVVPSFSALPAFAEAADGKLYFCEDTGAGYVLNSTRDGWTPIIHGVDNETIGTNASGLMAVKQIPISSVTGLETRLSALENGQGGGGISGLKPADASIAIVTDDDGNTTIGAKVSAVSGNVLTIKDDGMYASGAKYTVERLGEAADGYSTTYRLKETVDGVSVYVGDEINIPKDIMLQGGTLETATEANVPYQGAEVGDPYIDLTLNDPDSTHIYIPVKGIVDLSNKVDKVINNADGSRAMIFNEASGGGAMFTHSDGSQSYVGVSDGGMGGMMAQIYADKQLDDGSWVGSRINVYHDKIYYTKLADKEAGKANNAAECEIATKGDVATISEAISWQEM